MHKHTIRLLAAAVAAPVAGLVVARIVAAWRLRRDVRRLFAAASFPTRIYHEAQLAGLPAPVQRYFRHVLPDGQPYLRGLRLHHGGQFKTDLKKDWIAMEGQQYITADPPGFIWQGTTRQFMARDEFVAGRGRLDVRLLGAVPIAGGTGPAYDQGELLRWLVEITWLPTACCPATTLPGRPLMISRPGLRLRTGAAQFRAWSASMSRTRWPNARRYVKRTPPRRSGGCAASGNTAAGTACSFPPWARRATW